MEVGSQMEVRQLVESQMKGSQMKGSQLKKMVEEEKMRKEDGREKLDGRNENKRRSLWVQQREAVRFLRKTKLKEESL